MSKSKEDIMEGYESYRVMTDADYYEDLWPLGCIEQAMDEQSKAQSIAFDRWKHDNGWVQYVGFDTPTFSKGQKPAAGVQVYYSSEELYPMFLTHQSQEK